MARALTFALTLLLFCSSWGQPSSPILLKNANIVALGGGVEQTGRDVFLENGKIAWIRPASNKPFPGIEQIDASNKWLIPGLIDFRADLAYGAADSLAARQDLAELLAAGVTSVVNVGGFHAQAGTEPQNFAGAPAPRIYPGCTLFPAAATITPSFPGAFPAKNEQEARHAVRAAQKMGASLLHLDARLENAQMKAAVQEAQALNLPITGLALGYSFEEAARHGLNVLYDLNSLLSTAVGGNERKRLAQAWPASPAALYGARSDALFFESWEKIDPAKEARKKLGLLANRAVFFVPLLAFGEKQLQESAHTVHAAAARKTREKFHALLRAAFDLQVPLLMGSGYSARDYWRPTLQDELQAWIAAGLAPRFALEAATINAGHALRQSDTGQISEGMRADLLVLDEHPYQNFAALRRPWLIIREGHAYTREDLSPWRDSDRRAQREIHAVLQWQEQAWNNGDLERFMRGYWKSDSTIFASNSISRGWQAMLARYQRGYPTVEKMGRLKFTIEQIDMISREWAKVLGAWELAGLPENPRGWFTLILRRFDEGWRIVHDHTSSAPAAK